MLSTHGRSTGRRAEELSIRGFADVAPKYRTASGETEEVYSEVWRWGEWEVRLIARIDCTVLQPCRGGIGRIKEALARVDFVRNETNFVFSPTGVAERETMGTLVSFLV